MKANQKIINAFAVGKANVSNRNLRTSYDGTRLINYSTTIAQRINGKWYVNVTKYSYTTSKIQIDVKFTLGTYTEVSGVPMGTFDLARYIK
jgi:hypothetical protein